LRSYGGLKSRFFGKTTPYGDIFKILFRTFSPLQRSTLLCSNVVKFVRCEIGEIVVIYQTLKKFAFPLKLSLLPKWRPKSARAMAPNNVLSVPDFIQIGSLSAEL